MRVRRVWRGTYILVVAMLALALNGCCQSTPPGADIASGKVGQGGFSFMRWKQGLAIMIWHDLDASEARGSGSTRDPVYRLEGQASSRDGRRVEWRVETVDGRTGRFWIDEKRYDLDAGALFVISMSSGTTLVRQLRRDLSGVRPNYESCVAFAKSDPDLSRLIGASPGETGPPEQIAATDVPLSPDPRGGLEVLGYLSSAPIGSFDLLGELAYVAQGRMLAILRLDSADRAERLGFVVLPDEIVDVAVSGNSTAGFEVAYVALGGGGYGVVDVSVPEHPVLVDVHLAETRVRAVAIAGTYLYLSAGALHVLDLADPATPVEVGVYRPVDVSSNAGEVLAASGSQIVVLYHSDFANASSLYVLDLSDPAMPQVAGVYRPGVPILDGAVHCDYAYLLVGQGVPYLVVLDLADPSQPVAVGPEDTTAWLGQSLAMAEGTLYLASPDPSGGSGHVQILDVREPARPIPVGRFDGVPAPVVEMRVLDRYAFLASEDHLIVVDVSDPGTPVAAGSYDAQRLPGMRRGLAAAGDQVYIAAGRDGLWSVDVSDPANPRTVGHLDTIGHAWNVALWDGHAYVADEQGGLRVIEARDPTRMAEVGAYAVPGESVFFADVVISAHPSSGQVFAYVADALPGDTSLRILDVSNPAAPAQVGRLPLGEGVPGDVRAYGVATSGEHVYLGVGGAGLRVVDVSDPSKPVEVGSLDVPGRAANLAAAGDRVYLVDGDLRILDVSEPTAPREIGFYDVPNLAPWPYLTADGHIAYLTALGTRVLNVSDPAAIQEVAHHPVGYGAIAVGEGQLYMLGDGLYVMRAREPGEAIRDPTARSSPECADYRAEMDLRASSTLLDVGDVITVTASLVNHGCGTLGLPRYTLYLETADGQPIFVEMPEPVVHLLGVTTGQADAVEYILQAAHPGRGALTAGASFEFHSGYPGPAYWGSASSGPLQIVVQALDPEPVLQGDISDVEEQP